MRWLKSEYTRYLEAEVARLRDENRALMNSILGTAGIPPMKLPSTSATKEETPSPMASLMPKRRSWFQVSRGRERKVRIAVKKEFDAARDAEILIEQEKRQNERLQRTIETPDA